MSADTISWVVLEHQWVVLDTSNSVRFVLILLHLIVSALSGRRMQRGPARWP